MTVRCPACNRIHKFNAAAMRDIVLAFVAGDAQKVTSTGVTTSCLELVSYLGKFGDANGIA